MDRIMESYCATEAVGNVYTNTRRWRSSRGSVQGEAGHCTNHMTNALQNDFNFLFRPIKKGLQPAQILAPFIKAEIGSMQPNFKFCQRSGGNIRDCTHTKFRALSMFPCVCVKWWFFLKLFFLVFFTFFCNVFPANHRGRGDTHVGVMFVWDVC